MSVLVVEVITHSITHSITYSSSSTFDFNNFESAMPTATMTLMMAMTTMMAMTMMMRHLTPSF